MDKESINYEIMIDIISNIVKKYIDNNEIVTEDGDARWLEIESQDI